ncbi:MAG: RNA polymerase sigma factor, partial [Actinomycetota bacterium]
MTEGRAWGPAASAMVPDDERALVLAFQRGNRTVYAQIYAHYRPRVEVLCRRMLLNHHDAEEAAQETFIRVYQALPRFNGRYQLGAWISRIATNVCLDNLRARTRHPVEVATLEVVDARTSPTEVVDGPETALIRRSEGRRVRKVLASLPPLHRAAIVLRDFEGLSYGEIAGALGITEAQVKALLHRARKGFRRSWSSLASIFVPVRLVQRLRGLETHSAEHASGGLSTLHVASSCTPLLQGCGTFVAERVAPVVAAVVVGTAAASAAVSPAPDPARPSKTETVTTIQAEVLGVTETSKARSGRGHTSAPAPSSDPVTNVAPTPASSPAPEPSPSAEPSPAEEPPDKEAPAADVFTTAIGFDRGSGVASSSVRSNYAYADCNSGSVTQRLEATVAEGSSTYEGSLDLSGDLSALGFVLNLSRSDGFDIEYEASAMTSSVRRDANVLAIEYVGHYENTDAPDAELEGLPPSGE